AKRVSASEVTSIITSVSSASLNLKTRSAMRRSSDCESMASRAVIGFRADVARIVLFVAAGRVFFADLINIFFRDLNCLLFRERHSYADILESRGRRSVSGAHGLHRLAFSAIRSAPQSPVIARADGVTTIPKFGGDAAVAGMLNHAAFFVAFNFPANFGGELK